VTSVRATQGAEKVHALCAQPQDRPGRLAVELVSRDRVQTDTLHDHVPPAVWSVEVVDHPGHVRGGVPALDGEVVQALERLVLSRDENVIGVLD
jgi:hypothetical protein